MNSVKRVTGILKALSEAPAGLPLSVLADRMKIPRSSAHRFLRSLVEQGFVSQSIPSRHYRLGPGVIKLGLAYLENLEIREVAAPLLRRLTERTGKASFLTVLDGDEAVCVETVEATIGNMGFFVRRGRQMPVHAAAAAQALLFHRSPEQIRRLVEAEERRRYTHNTVVDIDAVVQAVQKAAERGYATCYEELEIGVNAIAAPVCNGFGGVAASIAIVGLTATWSEDEPILVRELLATAADLSVALGYRPGPHRQGKGGGSVG